MCMFRLQVDDLEAARQKALKRWNQPASEPFAAVLKSMLHLMTTVFWSHMTSICTNTCSKHALPATASESYNSAEQNVLACPCSWQDLQKCSWACGPLCRSSCCCLASRKRLCIAFSPWGLGLTNPDALDAANASPAVKHVGRGDIDDLIHNHVGSHDPTDDADQSCAGMYMGLDCSPMPNLAHGIIYDDLINLISPTGGPSPQASDAGTDNSTPLRAPLLDPQLHALKVNPRSRCADTPVYAASAPAFISHALSQQQQQDENVVESGDCPGSFDKVGVKSLDSFQQQQPLQGKASCSQGGQSAAVPMKAEQACDGLPLAHGVPSGASCQPSPGSSADEMSQHGKKRSRSATFCLVVHCGCSSDPL